MNPAEPTRQAGEVRQPEKQIPAPERDLQNVSPHMPPASSPFAPVTRGIFATLAIGLGVVMMVMALLAALFGASPVPETMLSQDAQAAWLMVGLSGLFFAGSGVGILRRSLLLTLGSLILGMLCGWIASTIA